MFLPLIAVLALAAPAPAAEAPKLSFGGQIRARVESTSVQSYASAGLRRGQDLYLLRTRLHMGADAEAQKLKAFIQLQDSRTAGTEASVVANGQNVDLHQGYLDVLELFDLPLDLRAGRMEMSYGDQRLVSPLDWNNVGRAWDGARLKWRGDKWWTDAFVTKVKDVTSNRANSHFWGVYAQTERVADHQFAAYVFGRDNGDTSYTSEQGTRGHLSDRTVGARFKGARSGFDYSGEGAWQFGRKAGQAVRAWATAATAGYTFDAAWKPRLGVEHDFATGDDDPRDNRVHAFDSMYPFGHSYQGYQDVFAWKNGHDFAVKASATPKAGWTAAVDYHHFLLHRSADSWYDATNTTITQDVNGTSGRAVGNEIDVTVKGTFRELITLYFGYSRFYAGTFVRRTTGRGDRDWSFFQAAFSF